jgi:hypothetical protein
MIDVLKIRVSKTQLQAMPLNERTLFILLGYAANQLNLSFFQRVRTPDDEVESTLSGAQTQMPLPRIIVVLLCRFIFWWRGLLRLAFRVLALPLSRSPLCPDWYTFTPQSGTICTRH